MTFKPLPGILPLFALLIVAAPSVLAATVDDFKTRIYTNAQGGKLPYRIFIPRNFDSASKYPLVLFLHGAGERGTDNRLQLTGQSGVLVFVSRANETNHPCIMLAPQCPTGTAWGVILASLFGLLGGVQQEFNIDSDRLYVTGLSMGGFGTWALITERPALFAAAVPMSAGGDYFPLERITHLPTWNFHGAVDDTVKVSSSDYTIAALRAAGGDPIYTRYRIGGHAIWDTAYNTPGLVAWVMAQRRGVARSLAPLVTITDFPGASDVQSASAIGLAGTILSPDVTVTNVMWQNSVNNAMGTATGTTNWSIAGVPLSAGSSNIITVTAFGVPRQTTLRPEISFNATLLVKTDDAVATAITATGGFATISWTGGTPLYSLEISTNLVQGQWTRTKTTSARSETVPLSGPAAFYRVSAQSSFAPAVSVEDFLARVYTDTNGAILPYRLFVPANYEVQRRYPMVLFLHGFPEQGTNNESQLTYQPSPLVFVSPENQAEHPCFMVAPQCPPDGFWTDATRRRHIRNLITLLQAEYALDPDRIYITGLSGGAVGVWDSVTQNPNLFAAAVPISGNGMFTLQAIPTLPVWAFQAGDDESFGNLQMDRLIARFRNLGGKAIYTRYQTGGHAIWRTAYATAGLVDWVMAQRKGVNPATAPDITITTPAETRFTTADAAIKLEGTALSITAISNIIWTNIVTLASGSTTGATNWSFDGVPLRSGTNVLMAITSSGSGSTNRPGITTVNDTLFVTRQP